MAERFAIDAVVAELLDRAPDEARDVVATELVGAAAAHLEQLVGGRSAAAAVYAVADAMATRHVPAGGVDDV